ncbi:hypothetical protein FE257_008893 [Aspergillus nanangensis]|uniref:Uncharacterized protein n=1 Tax=Aspergillus nanangensis TaxID=2582783 RepID=A0AAD4GYE9_ASPNN|nr:hypothetical protein FE257_008893 [Aspergillus nanangensis]
MPTPHNRPKPRITWWMRLRRFIRFYETPLQIRGTLIRLRHQHKHPFLALLRLLLPLPTWHFSLQEPVPLRTMLNNISLLETRMTGLRSMESIPIWRARDTPIRSLYRIYEAMAAREYYAVGPEVEYFWYHAGRSWELSHVPDPRDADPVRYAILACIIEELAYAFNWRLSLGMRRDKKNHIHRKTFDEPLPPYTEVTAPSWAKRVPAIDVDSIADLPTDLLDSSGRLVLESGGTNPLFAHRNIITDTGHFYTV